MAKTMERAPTGADTLARIEQIIAAYPAVDQADLEYLLHWYRKEASAYDVGMLATNQDIHAGFVRFRADHIDRLTPADIMKALACIAVVAAFILAIAYLAH